MSQYGLIAILLTLVAFGVASIALIAFVNARKDSNDTRPKTVDNLDFDEAIELHREHVFLRRHPEWAGRDFRNDRSSPWHDEEGKRPPGQS